MTIPRAVLPNLFLALACLLTSGSLTLDVFLGVVPAAEPPGSAKEVGAKQTTGVESAVLRLANGDHVAGKMIDSPGSNSLVWQSPAFTTPFHFALNAVDAIHFPVREKLSQPEGNYCFELAGGDLLYGSLISLNEDEAEIDAGRLGRLHVERSILRRLYRWKQADLIYTGPSGLRGWRMSGNAKGWSEHAGYLVTDQKGAIASQDFSIPARARLEFELAWNGKPDFEFALGVGSDPKTVRRAFHFEVWEDELVVERETEREADVAALEKIKAGPGRIRLQAFLDQEQGRLLVFSASGQQLADLTVTTRKPQTFGGLQITNHSGDIRLECLRISRWTGAPPRAVEAEKARIHATDGTITYGQLKSYDAAKHEFTVDDDAEGLNIDEDQVQDVFLSSAEKTAARSVRAEQLSGLRISGDLVKIEQNTVWLKCPGIQEPIPAPIESLRALFVLEQKENAVLSTGRYGRIELAGTLLHGCLVDGRESKGGCLVWQPASSKSVSPLAHGVSGRVIYRDPPPPPKPQPARRSSGRMQVVQVVPGGGMLGGFQTLLGGGGGPPKARSSGKLPVLHLRCGDTIPCRVTSIDEEGVTFTSDVTGATFVGHKEIKALELIPDAVAATISKPKKERLLTLPRMQRDNPPTQLIRSVDGDYLRGRLLEMDDKQLKVEIRLETKTLPRDSVVRILWLHPDEISTGKPDPLVDDPPIGHVADQPTVMRVQALPSDGNRLTFLADQLEDSILSGRSELLGDCRVDLKKVDQLLIGSAIEQAALALAFHQWKLTAAADPLAAKDNGEGAGDGTDGQESPLVGKPAPDFTLDLLSGKKFHLADHKNKILVLDFWASWCGPCLQVMPQVDQVAHEFADQHVELIAINLQETSERVKTTLERLQLQTQVALDRDGLVAEKYGATSIPQTVVIDRDGKVARLFVGGSARFGEQLREALKSVLSDRPQKTD